MRTRRVPIPHAVPPEARAVADVWTRLATPTAAPALFDPLLLTALPDPVQRWLTCAIAPGTPLRETVVLAMSGRILISVWRPFTARQVLAAGRGYIWAATARFGPLPVRGYDRYNDATGEMRWRLAGLIPVASAQGPDITRSAAGRLASELVLTPAAALAGGVQWEALDSASARATITIDGVQHAVTITVGADGTLTAVEIPRWGPSVDGDDAYTLRRFRVVCTGEVTFGGFRMPAHIRAGWDLRDTGAYDDTDGAFIAYDITGATFV